MSVLTAFTTQVINLATELNNMYPTDTFFRSALTAANFLKKTNPRLMHNLMMTNMKEYRTQIFDENDDFFAEKINELEERRYGESETKDDGESQVGKLADALNLQNVQAKKDQFNFVLRVRTYWNEMSPKTKKNIWMYLKVLFKLSDRI